MMALDSITNINQTKSNEIVKNQPTSTKIIKNQSTSAEINQINKNQQK